MSGGVSPSFILGGTLKSTKGITKSPKSTGRSAGSRALGWLEHEAGDVAHAAESKAKAAVTFPVRAAMSMSGYGQSSGAAAHRSQGFGHKQRALGETAIKQLLPPRSAAGQFLYLTTLGSVHGIEGDQVAAAGRIAQREAGIAAKAWRATQPSRALGIVPPHLAGGVAKAGEPVPAGEKLVGALSGARRIRNAQEAGYSTERARRAAVAEHIYKTVADPHEADRLVSQALKGDLPKIHFNGLKDFTHQTLTELKIHVNQHPHLTTYQRKTLNDALSGAYEGKTPTHSQLDLIEHVFGKQNRTALAGGVNHSALDKALMALNVPRSLMATADLSAPFRQGLVAMASHPILSGKQFPSMIKYFGSAEHYAARQAAIKADPAYHLALAGKLSLTDLGPEASLLSHEESLAGVDYASKIPIAGHVVKASGRAYTGYLNDVRMVLFKHQLGIAQAAGRNVHDETFLTDIGKVINAATGRGTIGPRGEHIMPALNTVMFSPRLMLSRINYMNPVWYAKLSPQARHEALRGLFATAGAVSSALYLFSQIPGVEVGSLDPRNANFGKLRIGNTRVDIAAGFQQYVRLASELATQTKVSSITGKKTKLGSGYGKPTAWDEIMSFFLNKAAPPVSMTRTLVSRKDSAGNPVTPQRFLQNYFTPLILQDARDLYREHHGGMNGIEWALGGYGVGMMGVGLQTYGPKPTKPKALSTGTTSGFGTSNFGSDFQLGGTFQP